MFQDCQVPLVTVYHVVTEAEMGNLKLRSFMTTSEVVRDEDLVKGEF